MNFTGNPYHYYQYFVLVFFSILHLYFWCNQLIKHLQPLYYLMNSFTGYQKRLSRRKLAAIQILTIGLIIILAQAKQLVEQFQVVHFVSLYFCTVSFQTCRWLVDMVFNANRTYHLIFSAFSLKNDIISKVVSTLIHIQTRETSPTMKGKRSFRELYQGVVAKFIFVIFRMLQKWMPIKFHCR